MRVELSMQRKNATICEDCGFVEKEIGEDEKIKRSKEVDRGSCLRLSRSREEPSSTWLPDLAQLISSLVLSNSDDLILRHIHRAFECAAAKHALCAI
jgi:hypothetical protein